MPKPKLAPEFAHLIRTRLSSELDEFAWWKTLRTHRKGAAVKQLTQQQLDWLAEVEEFLEDHSDVTDGDDGRPRANRAMQLLSRMEELGLTEEHL